MTSLLYLGKRKLSQRRGEVRRESLLGCRYPNIYFASEVPTCAAFVPPLTT